MPTTTRTARALGHRPGGKPVTADKGPSTEDPADIAHDNEAIYLQAASPAGSDLVRQFAVTPAATDFFAGEADDLSRSYRDMPLVDLQAAPLWVELGTICEAQAAALKTAYTIVVHDDLDPYETAEQMHADIARGVYQVTSLHSHHPVWTPQTNVAFRIVHDILGHGVALSDFSFKGEVEAYQAQCKVTPAHLWPVLFTEVIAQSAYANTHHLFGEQKVGLVPLTQAQIDTEVGKVMDGPDPAYDALHYSASRTATSAPLDHAIAAFAAQHLTRLLDPEEAAERCVQYSEAFVATLAEHGLRGEVVSGVRYGEFMGHRVVEAGHFAVQVGDAVVDWTARQFDPDAPVPLVQPATAWREQWQRLGAARPRALGHLPGGRVATVLS